MMVVVALLLLLSLTNANNNNNDLLVQWIRHHHDGGVVHKSLEIIDNDNDDNNLLRSSSQKIIVATTTQDIIISKDTILFQIPPACTIVVKELQVGDWVSMRMDDDDMTAARFDSSDKDLETITGVISSITKEGTTSYYDLRLRDPTSSSSEQEEEMLLLQGVERHEFQLHETRAILRRLLQLWHDNDNPYLQYLLRQRPHRRHHRRPPYLWSLANRQLLQQVLGMDHRWSRQVGGGVLLVNAPLLPPNSNMLTTLLEEEWHANLQLLNNEDDDDALLLLLWFHGWQDRAFVPFLDMIQHDSSRSNTEIFDDNNGMVTVRASRDIVAGEALTINYYNNNYCRQECNKGSRRRQIPYGTPHLFQDYGFVESSSKQQRWLFWYGDLDDDDGETEYWIAFDVIVEEVLWLDDLVNTTSTRDSILYMKRHLQRLRDLQHMELLLIDDDDDPELDTLVAYHGALVRALELAIPSAEARFFVRRRQEECNVEVTALGEAAVPADDDDVCHINDDETILLRDYDPLQRPTEEFWSDERPDTCDTLKSMNWHRWKTISRIQTPYQSMEFHRNPADDDVCMDLNDIFQICSSYRPHYHEVAVHYSARFLVEPVKRVVFVGGGDSMLLHEILKFEQLEKVVGLELDQQVTRSSFRYFGTQPHWDDPRVEWWYGDAAKSLALLPADYFGSFDLVLVDLSETVVAMSVTSHLTVQQALRLLAKPTTGLVVKNEYMYFMNQSQIFDHTLHIHFYDVPIVCSQSMILSSVDSTNFMAAKRLPQVKHNLTSPLLLSWMNKSPYKKKDYHYDLYHDYQYNPLASTKASVDSFCSAAEKEEEEPLTTTTSSKVAAAGVVMIVEMEGATRTYQPTQTLLDTVILPALEQSLDGVVEVLATLYCDRHHVVMIFIRHGYIILNFRHHYVGLDLHVWSGELLTRQEEITNVLAKAVGGATITSSYRIVAGGMLPLPPATTAFEKEDHPVGPQQAMDAACQTAKIKTAKEARKQIKRQRRRLKREAAMKELEHRTTDDDDGMWLDNMIQDFEDFDDGGEGLMQMTTELVLEHLLKRPKKKRPDNNNTDDVALVLCGQRPPKRSSKEKNWHMPLEMAASSSCSSLEVLQAELREQKLEEEARRLEADGDEFDGEEDAVPIQEPFTPLLDIDEGPPPKDRPVGIDKIVPLWTTCQRDDMFACENQTFHKVAQFFKAHPTAKIRAIVLDGGSGATKTMAQVLLRIFSSRVRAQRWLDLPRLLVLSLSLRTTTGDDDDSIDWRREFVDIFRRDLIVTEPVFNVEASFRERRTLNELDLLVTQAGDRRLVKKIIRIAGLVRHYSKGIEPVTPTIHRVRGGQQLERREIVRPNESFTHKDYDMEDALNQHQSQLQLGYQTLFQFRFLQDDDGTFLLLSTTTIVRAVNDTLHSIDADAARATQWILAAASSQAAAAGLPATTTLPNEEGGCLIGLKNKWGHAVILYDGSLALNLNLFTYEESPSFAALFERRLQDQFLPLVLERQLLDQQPRGMGRIVLFKKDSTEAGRELNRPDDDDNDDDDVVAAPEGEDGLPIWAQ